MKRRTNPRRKPAPQLNTVAARMQVVVGAASYVPFSAIAGCRLEPELLIRWVRGVNWLDGLEKTAELSSRLTWSRSELHGQLLLALRPTLIERGISVESLDRLLCENPTWSLVTEQGLLTMAAMFVLYGSDDGAPLNDQLCSVLLAGLHDYVDDWQIEDNATVRVEDRLLAVVARALRFNQHPLVTGEIARAATLLSARPRRQKQLREDWDKFQEYAFGTDARSYVVHGAGVLAHLVTTPGGTQVDPRINVASLPTVGFSRAVIEASSIERSELASELIQHTIRGIPAATPIFFRKPFVRVDRTSALCISPAMALGALHLGLWGRCLGAAKRLYGDKNGPNYWGAAFGDMFEDWCIKALGFAKSEGLRDEVLDSEHDKIEIADIVLRRRNIVVLVSIKAKTMPENVVKTGFSASETVRWYEQFLFAHESSGRKGAMRQLNAAVERIRSGAVPFIDREAEIVPLCVSFDDIGESVPFYQWLHPRCNEEALLQQRGVHAVTVSSVHAYEQLLARAIKERSRSLVTAMRDKVCSTTWRTASLERFLQSRKGTARPLEAIRRIYAETAEEMAVNLFGEGAREAIAKALRTQRARGDSGGADVEAL